jgi:hypothetical protein
VARHIFQACPVWVYTQSHITQASYSPEYITPTQQISCYKLFTACSKLFDNLGQIVRTQLVDGLLADLLQEHVRLVDLQLFTLGFPEIVQRENEIEDVHHAY